MHVADILRISTQAQFGTLPSFLKSGNFGGVTVVSQAHFPLFLEVRAYLSMIATMHLQGATEDLIIRETAIWYNALINSLRSFPGGEKVLDEFQIIDRENDTFDFDRVGELADEYENWIRELI